MCLQFILLSMLSTTLFSLPSNAISIIMTILLTYMYRNFRVKDTPGLKDAYVKSVLREWGAQDKCWQSREMIQGDDTAEVRSGGST